MTKRALAVIASSFFFACGSSSGWHDDVPATGNDDASTGASNGQSNGGGGANGGSNGGGTNGGNNGGGTNGGNNGGGTNGGGAGDAGGGSGDDAGDPYNTPTVCTSAKTWALGDTASPEMHPGVACDTCHKVLGSATKFPFDIAGTVYPTAHEPDECYGVTGASVVITDANKQDHTLAVNAAGNFYNLNYVLVGAIATPYTAKVVFNGKERAMITPQTNGDCNSCHTEQGTQSAQGRIMLP